MRPVIDDEKGTTGMRTWTDAVRVAVGIRLWRIGDAVIGGRLLAAAARVIDAGDYPPPRDYPPAAPAELERRTW
jgi:hypothetical protein